MKERVLKYMFLCAIVSICAIVIFVAVFPNIMGIIAGIIVALLLSAWLSGIFAKKISQSLLNIDPDDVDPDECDSELKPLLRKIVRQEAMVSQQLSELKRRQNEFFAITENMAEGIIVCDKNGEIILSNTHARNMLLDGGDANSVFEFCSDSVFVEKVNTALQGKVANGEFTMPGKVYMLFANPLVTENQPEGAVILLLDKTEEELRETLRREFTSNVSHELKTPLTSIFGISEILSEGIVRPEDIPKFSKSIYDETGRLITLVNDIIKLSQMDENSIMEEKDAINLMDIGKNVCARLEKVAQKKNVTLTLKGEGGYVFGIKGILEEMLYNLADNGIKYNKDGGKVTVNIDKKNNKVIATVSDTGIGISNEHIGRIFERFYRVDKSHSKQVGGTGLGLSIVKHGASFHGATIDVKSIPNKGTEITIAFPEYKQKNDSN